MQDLKYEETNRRPAHPETMTSGRQDKQVASRSARIRGIIDGTAHLQRLVATAYPELVRSQRL